jgi:NADH-quinone oxidoreductase subunit K
MCIELMLNAVNLTFVTFSRPSWVRSMGRWWSSSRWRVAAAEVVVGLGIIVAIFGNDPRPMSTDQPAQDSEVR